MCGKYATSWLPPPQLLGTKRHMLQPCPFPSFLANLNPPPNPGTKSRSLPVHQADIIEVDTIKNKQANISILEGSFL